jgi:hypothetical protein
MPNVRKEPSTAPIYSPLAGLLSYLVPGLGQIYQGRISKGILFFVCLYGLFFAGMAQGHWQNVYLPDTAKIIPNTWNLPRPVANLYNRLQFVGQFWIGVAAWPAVWQYATYDSADKAPFLWNFERTPSEDEINKLQRDRDKTWDLGWVYTVIAGILNILVIYDALVGPAFAEGETRSRVQQETSAA